MCIQNQLKADQRKRGYLKPNIIKSIKHMCITVRNDIKSNNAFAKTQEYIRTLKKCAFMLGKKF